MSDSEEATQGEHLELGAVNQPGGLGPPTDPAPGEHTALLPTFTTTAPDSLDASPVIQIDETPPSPAMNGPFVSSNQPDSDSEPGMNFLRPDRPPSPGAVSTCSTVSYLGYDGDNNLTRKVGKKKRRRPSLRRSVSNISINIDFEEGVNSDTDDDLSDVSLSQDVTLVYASHERIPKKDFHHEVQAKKDLTTFFGMVVPMLDIDEISLQDILETMLDRVLQEEPQCTMGTVRSSLLTHDSVHHFAKTIQGTSETEYGSMDYDQSWICAFAALHELKKRHVVIARLKHPRNLGETSQEVQFIVLVLAPRKEKTMRNALETARTFSTLLMYPEVRQDLLDCQDELEFMAILKRTEQEQQEQQKDERKIQQEAIKSAASFERPEDERFPVGVGIWHDIKRRVPHYLSDFTDGVTGRHSLHKLLSATVFVYFACVLPSIAFGTLNDRNTHGAIDVKKVMVSQTIGGVIFGLLSGQPLIILSTTAPLALYTKIIYEFSHWMHVDFLPLFSLAGLFSCAFLVVYSVLGLSRVMKYTTRSVEEIFALFIVVAFVVDAMRSLSSDFYTYFDPASCSRAINQTSLTGNTSDHSGDDHGEAADRCQPERPLLHTVLLLGTLWLSTTLYSCTKSPYLTEGKRELLADYALPIAGLFNAFLGSYVFSAVALERFEVREVALFTMVPLGGLHTKAILVALGLGFCLSLLFFMDQNIAGAIVSNPAHKLKKGSAYHYDLLVLATINAILSVFGLPLLNGALPVSPLHVRALADVEVRIDQGHLYPIIIRVRETRMAAILSHLLVGLSLLLLPSPLNYISQPVLNGIFLFLAVSSLNGNQMFERLLLLFTEQSAYPPNHYIRRVPLGKIHLWSLSQVLQLGLVCGLGFSPLVYLEMVFPLVILSLMPIRHLVMPRLIDAKYIEALDAAHTDFQ